MTQEIWRRVDKGLELRIRATPKSSRDAISGVYEDADGVLSLKVAVRAQPEKGKANKAVIAVLAKQLGAAKSKIEICSGLSDRRKMVLISGDPATLEAQVRQLVSEVENG